MSQFSFGNAGGPPPPTIFARRSMYLVKGLGFCYGSAKDRRVDCVTVSDPGTSALISQLLDQTRIISLILLNRDFSTFNKIGVVEKR